jgi:NAD+ kinase
MKRFTVYSKNEEFSRNICKNITQRLQALSWTEDTVRPDIVISVGGDGTFLRAIHTHLSRVDEIFFVGIHAGTLGFFTDYDAHELDKFIQDLQAQNFEEKQFPLLEVTVVDQAQTRTIYALNEMRVENVKRTQLLRVFIDEQLMETYRGTGFCISTQAGSTAYNRSLGGAILYEGLNLLQLTEITGIHHQAYRSLGSPFIVHQNARIRLESDDFSDAILCYDHEALDLADKSIIHTQYSSLSIRVLSRINNSYLERLHSLF